MSKERKKAEALVEIEKLITCLRDSDLYVKHIYTEGGCYQFHLFLSKIFCGLSPYINKKKNHIVSRFGNSNKVYDIEGAHNFNDNYFPLSNEDRRIVEKWSFRNNNLIKLDECPFCEEPIIFGI